MTDIYSCIHSCSYYCERPECIKSQRDELRDRLAKPEQEPVARVIDNGTPEGATEWIPFTNRVEPLKTGDFLYTTPPQRKPLTEEQAFDLFGVCYNISVIRAVEAAHGIKENT